MSETTLKYARRYALWQAITEFAERRAAVGTDVESIMALAEAGRAVDREVDGLEALAQQRAVGHQVGIAKPDQSSSPLRALATRPRTS
jgi:predicted transcriptional regulator